MFLSQSLCKDAIEFVAGISIPIVWMVDVVDF